MLQQVHQHSSPISLVQNLGLSLSIKQPRDILSCGSDSNVIELLNHSVQARQESEAWAWSRYSHGEVDCIMDARPQHEILFGEVQAGLFAGIHVLRRDGKMEEAVLYSEK